MGYWFATELLRTNFLEGIDLIVPVPLHWRRRLTRGYNQTEYIALGISRKTGIKYCFDAVKRTINNPPQAGMEFINRWQHIENIFTTTKGTSSAGNKNASATGAKSPDSISKKPEARSIPTPVIRPIKVGRIPMVT